MARQLEIELVSEKCIKLQTNKCALGNDGSVLLLDGEEVLVCQTVGEDHSFATQCTNLSTTDIEDVTMTGQIGQSDVSPFCHQTIAQTCSVDVQRNVVVLAYLIDIVQFLGSIECT